MNNSFKVLIICVLHFVTLYSALALGSTGLHKNLKQSNEFLKAYSFDYQIISYPSFPFPKQISITCPSDMCVYLNTPPFNIPHGSPSGGTFSGKGVSGGIVFNPSIASTGDHQITYTVGSESCHFIISVASNFNTGSHNTDPVDACVGYNPAELSVSGYSGKLPISFQWFFDDTAISGANSETYNPDVIYASGNHNYNCRITDGCGTTFFTSKKLVNIVDDPVITINGGGIHCQNSIITLTTTITGGTGIFANYTWKQSNNAGGPWTTITGATSSAYNPPSITPGTIYYQVILDPNIASCNNTSVSIAVTVIQKSTDPTSATASETTIYYGQSTTLTLNGGGGGTGTVIKWYSGSCGGTLVGTGNNLNVTPPATTTYYGRYEDPAPCGPPYSICQSVLITVTDRLTISKSITQIPTQPGDPFSYQISYSNLNTSVTATGVIIKDVLPPASLYTYLSSSPLATFDAPTNTLTWNLGNVTPGNFTITVNGKLGSLGSTNWTSPTYDLTSFYIRYGGGTENPSNNATIQSTTITTPVNIPAPIVNGVSQFCGSSMQVDPASGYIKQSTPSFMYYSVSITNTGNITDKFSFSIDQSGTPDPKNLLAYSFVDINLNPLTFTPWLKPNETYSFLLRFDTPAGTNKGENNSNLIATSFVCQTQSTKNIITNIGNDPLNGPDLDITKTYSPNPAIVNQNTTFTITVRNLRADVAKNIDITDILDINLNFVSYSAIPAGVILSRTGQNISASLTTKDFSNVSAPIILTIVVKPSCGAVPSITNKATVSNANGDVNPSNNDAPITVTVISDITAPTASGTTICQGATASLTASTPLIGYGYKWYAASTGGTALFTGSPFTTPVLNITTTYYVSIYEIASPTCESSRTPVTVTVLNPPVYTAQPDNQTICDGANTSFAIVATGSSLNYQWQVNTGSGWNNLSNVIPYSGVNTSTLSLTNVSYSMNTYQYRCVTQAGTCTGVNSNSALLTVNPLPTGTLSNGGPICAGGSATITFTKTAGTGPFDLVINGTSYTNIASGSTVTTVTPASSTTYTLTSITDKGVTTNCLNTVSVPTTVTVNPLPSPSLIYHN